MLFNSLRKYPSSILFNHIISYPTPVNLSYIWSFGSLSGLALVIQIISGFLLSLHYVPDIETAFACVEQHIMRDVKNGWLIRYIHSNGASLFFVCLYIHIAKGLYFNSYKKPRHRIWISGIIIFILTMATAFLGYVLPWGQMSYWGATVITNLVTAIPLVGTDIAHWLWGGYSVGQPTLSRFYSFHYILPFIITGLVMLHLMFLHEVGSTNPLGIASVDNVGFASYFIIKDILSSLCFLFVLFFLVFFHPNLLSHSDNYIEANPLVTPSHIVPEWYFLPFYAILRAIPNKLLGVVAMAASILILFILPYFPVYFYQRVPTVYNKGAQLLFFLFCLSFVVLGYLGAQPVEPHFVIRAQIFSVFYFSYFLTIPLVQYFYGLRATILLRNPKKNRNNVKK